MKAFLKHFRIRLVATLRDPWALAVVLGTGLASFAVWPSPMAPSGPVFELAGQREAMPVATLLVFMWIWLWPALAGPIVGGRSSITGLGSSIALHPNPVLPIGARTRVLAEATLLLVAVLLVRVPALFAGQWIHTTLAFPGAYPGDAAWATAFATRSLIGAAIMLPSVVAWVIPCGNPQLLFARAGAVSAVQLVATWLGLLATPTSALAVSVLLVAIQLLLVGRELPGLEPLMRRLGSGGPLVRNPRPPERQLVRDFVLRPLPIALTLLAIQVALVVVDALWFADFHLLEDDGPGVLYAGSSLMFGVALGFVALRPMGSVQAIAGVFGKQGYRTGDFLQAFSVLPVRREVVLRGVYLHGLLATGAIWVVAIATGIVSEGMTAGSYDAAQFFGRSPGFLLVPMVAVVPCIAGMLTAGAAARKGMAMLAGISMIAVFHGHFVLLILKTPLPIHAGFLLLAAALGGVPVLSELRRPRAPAGAIR